MDKERAISRVADLLVSKDTTIEQLRSALEVVLQTIEEQNRVLFFYAGKTKKYDYHKDRVIWDRLTSIAILSDQGSKARKCLIPEKFFTELHQKQQKAGLRLTDEQFMILAVIGGSSCGFMAFIRPPYERGDALGYLVENGYLLEENTSPDKSAIYSLTRKGIEYILKHAKKDAIPPKMKKGRGLDALIGGAE